MSAHEKCVAIYDTFGDLLSNGSVEGCNRLLSEVTFETHCSKELLAMLMVTSQIDRQVLPSRSTVYHLAMGKFSKEIGETEALELLSRFE